jgi:hypothetical protein
MHKSSAQDQTPGGFEGRAGGQMRTPTPTAQYPAIEIEGDLLAEIESSMWEDAECGIAQSVEPRPVKAMVPGSIPGPTATVPYLMDIHGLSLAEAYLLAQRNHEAAL